ncbi:hypothetical protein [Streptococcus uberis]|uniref:hypothetical protein n=1 Tax=Streptococcus uberis TaxID=1349 RepID=UPI0018A77716|nr:hypothetical protein [Streptococcus uberis]
MNNRKSTLDGAFLLQIYNNFLLKKTKNKQNKCRKRSKKFKKESKIADRVLKNYHKFQRLATLSDKPFSIHGQKLVDEIDRVIELMPRQSKLMLCNQYRAKKPIKKSRKQFCLDHNISIEQYIELRESVLREFAKHYLNGVLLELKN